MKTLYLAAGEFLGFRGCRMAGDGTVVSSANFRHGTPCLHHSKQRPSDGTRHNYRLGHAGAQNSLQPLADGFPFYDAGLLRAPLHGAFSRQVVSGSFAAPPFSCRIV
jgi:hypothetical protein